MGFLRALRLALTGDAGPTMSANRPDARFSVDVPPEMMEAMTAGGSLAPRISRNEALQVPAVLRARNVLCIPATLPVRVHGPDQRVPEGTRYLVPDPDPELPASVMLAQTIEDLVFEGISWWRVTRFGWHGYPVEARHVPVESVHVAQTGSLLPSQTRIGPDTPFPAVGQVFIDGVPVPDEEVIRFDSPNPPLLRHAARAIRTCLRLDQTAATYSDEPLPLGFFTPKEGVDQDDEEIQEALDKWESARRLRAWGYVGGALDVHPMQWNPEQLQLADQRQHAVLEIARATGLDAEDLQVSTTTRTYQNSEQRRQDLLDFTLTPYVTAIQERLSMRDILPRGYVARFDFGGFLRSDTRTRMDTYKVGLEVGAYTEDEVRDLENRPKLTAAEKRARREATTPSPAAEPDDQKADDMAAPADAQFTDDGATQLTFDSPEVAQSFRVNVEKRTITGLAVPWGKVARSGFHRWRFSENSLRWADASRVKLNLHHDPERAIGYAAGLRNTADGLEVTFKVADVPEGDRALALAAGKVLDGLSIEVDFDDDDAWQKDPADDSVRLVHQGRLRGVALTAVPAFDDARLTGVVASNDHEKGKPMGDKPENGQPGAEFDLNGHLTRLTEATAESHKKLVESLGQSIGESVSAGFKTALENLPTPQEGPQSVRAARYTVTREEPVYMFNGMGHSLVRDAWYAAQERDDDSIARIRKYRQQSEEVAKLAASHVSAQFAPQSTSTASQVIPPGYRPDLYVSELVRGRPLVNACSRGSIANATPFTVPTFTSSTGASADHVEGTNPSDGSVAFSTKTVTPQAISGRLVLTREIVDSSNPAIDQIALATMRESYARQTEAKVFTLLNGANGAGGTITAGFVPSGAQAFQSAGGTALPLDIRKRLAAYPFSRFASPTVALMSQIATANVASAVGSDGRPLFPSVGAQNASGVGNAVSQGWFVDGLAFVPSWSMTGAVGATDTHIFIVNSADMWVWESPLLSFRFEEKQGPANIELNIFGYFGAHVLRPVGLSGIRMTAV